MSGACNVVGGLIHTVVGAGIVYGLISGITLPKRGTTQKLNGIPFLNIKTQEEWDKKMQKIWLLAVAGGALANAKLTPFVMRKWHVESCNFRTLLPSMGCSALALFVLSISEYVKGCKYAGW